MQYYQGRKLASEETRQLFQLMELWSQKTRPHENETEMANG